MSPNLSHFQYLEDEKVYVLKSDQSKSFAYSDGKDIEQKMLDDLKTIEDVSTSSDEIKKLTEAWPGEYHFSPTRHNLLRGLTFKSDMNVLEIGAGCGAITRFLGETKATVHAVEGSRQRARICAERCRGLDNVSVIHSDFNDFQSDKKYDVITLIGVLEYSPSFFQGDCPFSTCLQMCRQFLSDDGVLIIAIENRLGLKYFNSCREDHTQGFYDSITNNYKPSSVQTFGKVELHNLLQNNAYTEQEFIYPFPDYKFPKALIKESAIHHQGNLVSDILSHFPSRDYSQQTFYHFDEALAWKSIKDNHLLNHLSNSFIVLCGQSQAAIESISGSWSITSYTSERMNAFRTINHFDLNTTPSKVSKSKQFPDIEHPSSLNHILQKNIELSDGELVSNKLFRTIRQGDHQSYLSYLIRWKNLLADLCIDSQSKMLPGQYFDATVFNLIENKQGDLVLIDQEWEYAQDIEMSWIIFRGLVYDLLHYQNATGQCPFLSMNFGSCLLDIVNHFLKALGMELQEEQIQTYLKREGQITHDLFNPNHTAEYFYQHLNETLKLEIDKVRTYETHRLETQACLQKMQKEIDELRHERDHFQEAIKKIEGTRVWQMAQKYYRFKQKLGIKQT